MHRVEEQALLAATRERDPLVDDVQPGGAKRLLREVAHVRVDRDHVPRLERDRPRDYVGNVGRERHRPAASVRASGRSQTRRGRPAPPEDRASQSARTQCSGPRGRRGGRGCPGRAPARSKSSARTVDLLLVANALVSSAAIRDAKAIISELRAFRPTEGRRSGTSSGSLGCRWDCPSPCDAESRTHWALTAPSAHVRSPVQSPARRLPVHRPSVRVTPSIAAPR